MCAARVHRQKRKILHHTVRYGVTPVTALREVVFGSQHDVSIVIRTVARWFSLSGVLRRRLNQCTVGRLISLTPGMQASAARENRAGASCSSLPTPGRRYASMPQQHAQHSFSTRGPSSLEILSGSRHKGRRWRNAGVAGDGVMQGLQEMAKCRGSRSIAGRWR